MGMYNGKAAAGADVKPTTTYLQAGIHNVVFSGVKKGENSAYNTIEFTFTAPDGAVHNERLLNLVLMNASPIVLILQLTILRIASNSLVRLCKLSRL